MPSLWFLIFVWLCAGFVAVKAIRAFRGDGLYIFGQRIYPEMVIAVFALFLIVMGIITAIGLGFITDYAP